LSRLRHDTKPRPGTVSGAAAQLIAPAQLAPRLLVGGPPMGMNEPPRIRSGEVIVRFDEVLTAEQAAPRLKVDGLTFKHGGFASQHMHLARYSGAKGAELSEVQTRELVA